LNKSEDFDQFDDLPPFSVNVDPSILLSKEDTPYLHRDHNQGTFIKRKIINCPSNKDEYFFVTVMLNLVIYVMYVVVSL
jgi:hypothetical protein